jgi:integrase
MPRKPKLEKKIVQVVIDGTPVAVTLHPPAGARRSWYAYWGGLVASKSTGHTDFSRAAAAAEQMLRQWKSGGAGDRPRPADMLLTDEEFKALQRAHFERKQDAEERERALKSLKDCLEAMDAFRDIIRMDPINFNLPLASVTADICAAFQRKALTLPRNWRKKYPRSKSQDMVPLLQPNTVLKWSRSLQAAFQRANRNGGKKKVVRGVVPESKLLSDKPWHHFDGITGTRRLKRRFDGGELLSFLEYLERKWVGLTFAPVLAKVFLWSWARRSEVHRMRWDQLRVVGGEYHFETVGKAGVKKWFRVPEGVYRELQAIRTESPYLFASYSAQVRSFYAGSQAPWKAGMVKGSFGPTNLADWFHHRLLEWSMTLPKGKATTHIFRKTGLQFARSGADFDQEVARAARVTVGVMTTHYVTRDDEQLLDASNDTYRRILNYLLHQDARWPGVASRYGYAPPPVADTLEAKLKAATEAKDWELVGRLSAELSARRSQPAG